MRQIFTCLLLLFALSGVKPAYSSNPVLIDFESLARGEMVEDQYHSNGLHVRASNWSRGPNAAVVFDTSNIGLSEDTDLQAPLDPAPGFENLGDLSPGNILILHEREDCTDGICAEPDDESTRPAGWIELEFAVPVTLHGFKLLDLNYETGEDPAKLVLYDEFNVAQESLDVPGVDGQGNWRPWSIERSGVKRARLYLPGDGAIDDISFTPESIVNWTPTFISHPPVAVSPLGEYRYRPQVADRDNDTTSISLVSGPNGMVLSPEGELSWSPAGVSGSFAVVIAATDTAGNSTQQAFTVHAEENFLRVQEFGFPAGTILDNELLADGMAVSAGNKSKGTDFAVVFDTNAPTGDDTDLAAPFAEGSNNDLGLGPRMPGAVVILHERHDCDVQDLTCAEPDDESSSPAGWIEFHFSQPAHVWSLEVFDITSDDPGARTVELYDAADAPLATGISLPRTGSNDWDRLIIDVQGVHRMRVNMDGDGALDNLRYALVGTAQPQNQPPVINDEEFEIFRDETLTLAAPGVLANDYDPDGDPITAVLDEEPWHGTVVLNPDGSFVYTPPPGFTGKDEFEYRVRDAESASIPEDVEIYVNAPPEPAIINSFTADPAAIFAGESATLAWNVDKAVSLSMSPYIGPLVAVGSQAVAPTTTTTYTLTATGTDAQPVSASIVIEVLPPPPPVTIAISSPTGGVWLATPRPEIVIDYIETGSGIDTTTLAFTANGAALAVSCAHDIARSRCVPSADLAQGAVSISVQVSDTNGTASNLAEVSFNIDSVAPAPVVREKVTLVQEPAGTVTITGEPGAAEPGQQILVRNGAQETIKTTSADGSFNAVIAGNTGESIDVLVRDLAGNASDAEAFVVQKVPLQVWIVTPVEGDTIAGTVIEVSGRHNGPFGTGVTVNGYSAAVADDGAFYLSSLALSEGANTLTAVAKAPNGESANAQILVDAQAAPPSPLRFQSDYAQAPAPHEVRFELVFDGDIDTIQRMEIDYNGDGVIDKYSINPFEEFVHTFSAPGVYHPRATVVTQVGTYTATSTVIAEDVVALNAFLQAQWSEFIDGLATGDKTRALAVMSPGARKRFAPVFDTILPVIQSNLASWQSPQAIQIKGDMAEYLILRENNGKQYGYPVTFLRMPDGTWKLTNL